MHQQLVVKKTYERNSIKVATSLFYLTKMCWRLYKCIACFPWKHSSRIVFIFSSKTRELVWCGLKQAENGLKTSYVFDLRLSLGENAGFQKWAFSACFQAENDPFKNSGTVVTTHPFLARTLKRMRRSSADSASADCKAGPSSILGSAPNGSTGDDEMERNCGDGWMRCIMIVGWNEFLSLKFSK